MFEQDNLQQQVRNSALASLTRREHSRAELQDKLQQKFSDTETINATLTWLESLAYLDDRRFACSFVRMSIAKGRGPIRIKQELRQKGIDTADSEYALAEEAVDWHELAEDVLVRKFRSMIEPEAVITPKEKARRIRFLQSRGFDSGIIFSLV